MARSTVLERLRGLDLLSKLAIISLVGAITYMLFMLVLNPLIITPTLPLSHAIPMGDHLMSFASPEQAKLNILSIVAAITLGALTALLLRTSKHPEKPQQKKEDTQIDELSIIKKVLSADEKRLVTTVEEAGEITQDSLTFRLEWSRAKISTILTHLERMNIVQRRREGKTYVVFISKKNGDF